MSKRKRGAPSLEEQIEKWEKELQRGLKTAKGFERQRYAKRIRDSPPEKVARLEKEILILKSLDLHQAAHAHLCSSLLKIKGVAESPKLPAQIKPVPKPDLSEEERTALHNVTSGLCNRKQVKDIIEQAVMGTCIALRVPMPEKKGKGKGKDKETNERAHKEDQADDISTDDVKKSEKGVEPQDKGKDQEDSQKHILLKRRGEKEDGDGELEDDGDAGSSDDEEVFEGFSDSDAEERAFSRYDNLLGGSSDEEDSDDESIEEGDSDDLLDSRSKSIRRVPAADDISISSLEESDEASSASSSEDESLRRPSKIAKTKRAKAEPIKAGNSAFLPTLMGGYISGSESASDVDVAPSLKKNRRGQRARQAIWEKKYGEKAKHKLLPPKDSRDQGWDMQRGAVDPDDGAARPWKRGIRNPFEKSAVHPERMRHIEKGGHRQPQQEQQYTRDQSSRNQDSRGWEKPAPKPPRPEPTRDDTGHLHPSWAAAKKAKEEGQKVAFQGRKVVFD
ncbi:hypothetical protein SLS62_004923 [Diatrype stigma]|uniref:Bud22 domain-containing protein n=1 Tax=Diatrype stigma TaxID=117547 RepID=A0AAN9UVX0_9PEZI